MPSESRREYMRQYMRDRRAMEREQVAMKPDYQDDYEEEEEAEDGSFNWFVFIVIGFIILVIIAGCIGTIRNKNQPLTA